MSEKLSKSEAQAYLREKLLRVCKDLLKAWDPVPKRPESLDAGGYEYRPGTIQSGAKELKLGNLTDSNKMLGQQAQVVNSYRIPTNTYVNRILDPHPDFHPNTYSIMYNHSHLLPQDMKNSFDLSIQENTNLDSTGNRAPGFSSNFKTYNAMIHSKHIPINQRDPVNANWWLIDTAKEDNTLNNFKHLFNSPQIRADHDQKGTNRIQEALRYFYKNRDPEIQNVLSHAIQTHHNSQLKRFPATLDPSYGRFKNLEMEPWDVDHTQARQAVLAQPSNRPIELE